MCVYEMIIFQAYTYVGTRVKAKHAKDLIKHMTEGIQASNFIHSVRIKENIFFLSFKIMSYFKIF